MARQMICNMPDEEIYKKQCISLEKNLPGIMKIEELHDVDDSKIMKYEFLGKSIKVMNSYYHNGVYLDSEIDLLPYFEK